MRQLKPIGRLGAVCLLLAACGSESSASPEAAADPPAGRYRWVPPEPAESGAPMPVYFNDEVLSLPPSLGMPLSEGKTVSGNVQFPTKEYLVTCVVLDASCQSMRFIFERHQPSSSEALARVSSFLPLDRKLIARTPRGKEEMVFLYNSPALARTFASRYHLMGGTKGDFVVVCRFDAKGTYLISVNLGRQL